MYLRRIFQYHKCLYFVFEMFNIFAYNSREFKIEKGKLSTDKFNK